MLVGWQDLENGAATPALYFREFFALTHLLHGAESFLSTSLVCS